jgi:hypothetical protein
MGPVGESHAGKARRFGSLGNGQGERKAPVTAVGEEGQLWASRLVADGSGLHGQVK